MQTGTGCMTDAQRELSIADGYSDPWFDLDGSDGLEFIDSKGTLNRVGGDALVIRCDNDKK